MEGRPRQLLRCAASRITEVLLRRVTRKGLSIFLSSGFLPSTPPLPHVRVSGLAPRSSTGDPTLSLSGTLGFPSPNKQTSCSAQAKVNCCTGSSSTPATGFLSSASSHGIEAVRPNNLRFPRPFHAAFLDRLSHRSSVTQLTHMVHHLNSTFFQHQGAH